MQRENLIKAIRGETPMDLVIEKGQVVNVMTGSITKSTIGIKDGLIAAVLPEQIPLQGDHRVNAEGFYILPGFIDAFSGFSKSMLHPFSFSEMLLPYGVTTAVGDMTSFAEVFGSDGTASLLNVSQNLPINMYYTAPVQVPVLPERETTGGEYQPDTIASLLNSSQVLGIGPLLNPEEILSDSPRMSYYRNLLKNGFPLASSLTHFGELQKQEALLYGVDVELSSFERNIEAALSRGQYVPLCLQDLNAERMEQILALPDRSRLFFYSGKEWSDFYMRHGHVDEVVKKAILLGMNPVEAIQCATSRPAKCLGLEHLHGFIGAGLSADLLFTRSITALSIEMVIRGGQVSYTKNKEVEHGHAIAFPPEMSKSIEVKRCWPHHFKLPQTEQDTAKAHVLTTISGSAELNLTEKTLTVDENKQILCGKDMVRAILFERYGKGNNLHQLALIQGIGTIDGAIATTYAPHSHPLLVLGNDESDMAMAANMLIASGGGMVAVQKGQLIQSVDLPVGGVCTDETPAELAQRLTAFSEVLRQVMGMRHHRPLDWLTSLCDTTLPGYHLTDYGIVSSERQEVFPLWIDTEVIQVEETYQ